MNSLHVFYLCGLLVFLHQTSQSAAVRCSQCNFRFLGVQNLCIEPRNATGCVACMKTVAKVKLRDSGYIDGWERMSIVVSRLCITLGNINVKPAGCYKQQSNGGYTERCYCYTDYCNSGATRPTLGFLTSIFSPTSSFYHTSTIVVLLQILLSASGVNLAR